MLRPSFVFGTYDKTGILCFEKSGGWTSSPGPEMVFFKCREVEYFLPRLLPGSRDRVRDRKLPSTEHEAGVQCRCLCLFLLLSISTHVTSGILNCSFSDSFSFFLIVNIVREFCKGCFHSLNFYSLCNAAVWRLWYLLLEW